MLARIAITLKPERCDTQIPEGFASAINRAMEDEEGLGEESQKTQVQKAAPGAPGGKVAPRAFGRGS